jgi:hypothetical protein
MAKKKSKTQKLKKSIKKKTTAAKKVVAKKPLNKKPLETKKHTTKKVAPKKTNIKKDAKEEPLVLPKKKITKRKLVSSNKVQYKLYEEEKKKTPPRKQPIKKTIPKKTEVKKPVKKIEKPKLEAKEVDITKIEEIDLEKTVNIIIPKEELAKTKKGTIAPKEKVKSKLFDKLFSKKTDRKTKNKIMTTNHKNINDLKALFNSPTKNVKKQSKFALFFAGIKNKFKKKPTKEPKVKQEAIVTEPEQIEEIEEVKEKRVPKNPILRVLYEIYHYSFIFFNVLLIATFILLVIGLKRVEVIPNKMIIYIALIFVFLGAVAISYNKYLSGKIFTLFLVGLMGAGIYILQYNFDFLNNLNTKEYEYKEYNVVAFDNAYNKSIYNINNKKVCLLNSNAKNEERVLNLKLDDVEYLTYDTQDEMFEDFYKGKCRAVIVTSNQIKFLANNKENEKQNIKVLYTFKANGHK